MNIDQEMEMIHDGFVGKLQLDRDVDFVLPQRSRRLAYNKRLWIARVPRRNYLLTHGRRDSLQLLHP
jgi:hypothetical protein